MHSIDVDTDKNDYMSNYKKKFNSTIKLDQSFGVRWP
jgi:hypothetical protein